jgi:hypothetical protein
MKKRAARRANRRGGFLRSKDRDCPNNGEIVMGHLGEVVAKPGMIDEIEKRIANVMSTSRARTLFSCIDAKECVKVFRARFSASAANMIVNVYTRIQLQIAVREILPGLVRDLVSIGGNVSYLMEPDISNRSWHAQQYALCALLCNSHRADERDHMVAVLKECGLPEKIDPVVVAGLARNGPDAGLVYAMSNFSINFKAPTIKPPPGAKASLYRDSPSSLENLFKSRPGWHSSFASFLPRDPVTGMAPMTTWDDIMEEVKKKICAQM